MSASTWKLCPQRWLVEVGLDLLETPVEVTRPKVGHRLWCQRVIPIKQRVTGRGQDRPAWTFRLENKWICFVKRRKGANWLKKETGTPSYMVLCLWTLMGIPPRLVPGDLTAGRCGCFLEPQFAHRPPGDSSSVHRVVVAIVRLVK